MKILLATESYHPNIDGGAVAQYNLVNELKKRGHDVRVIAPNSSFKNVEEKVDNKISIHRTRGVKLPFYMSGRYYFSPFPFFKVGKIIKDFKPDIVQLCSPYPIGISTMIWARKNDIPVSGAIHLLPENMLSPFMHSKRYSLYETRSWGYLVYFFNLVDWATNPTKTGADMYKEQGLKTNVTPISNGIDTSIFNPENDGEYLREKFNLPKKNIVLYTGRINEEKSLDVLIKAIPHVVKKIDAHFVLVGEGGDYKNYLIKLTGKLGVKKHTTFTSFLEWKDLPNIYAMADLFAMPSEAELQSIVTLEAVATGLPVVVVNKGALPELASNNNGLLFEPKDHEQMAEQIIKILKDDKLRNEMSKNSLELVKKHTLKSIAEQYEKVYEKTIEYYHNKK